jgi:hypothetical protein
MKKSNKLLLGGFLTVILMITGIHIALYAKYKNGDYTIYHPEDRRKDKSEDHRMQTFPNASFVVLRNVGGATIQFGEMAAVEKGKEDLIQYIQKGDSLIFTGPYDDIQPEFRHNVHLTLPENATLFVVNSFIYFQGDAGQLSIVTDSVSRLSLQSKHLLKAKIITIPNKP